MRRSRLWKPLRKRKKKSKAHLIQDGYSIRRSSEVCLEEDRELGVGFEPPDEG